MEGEGDWLIVDSPFCLVIRLEKHFFPKDEEGFIPITGNGILSAF